jgi:hypothetical protein
MQTPAAMLGFSLGSFGVVKMPTGILQQTDQA